MSGTIVSVVTAICFGGSVCRANRTFPMPAGVSLLAGIGFTMAILFAGLAIPELLAYHILVSK